MPLDHKIYFTSTAYQVIL